MSCRDCPAPAQRGSLCDRCFEVRKWGIEEAKSKGEITSGKVAVALAALQREILNSPETLRARYYKAMDSERAEMIDATLERDFG